MQFLDSISYVRFFLNKFKYVKYDVFRGRIWNMLKEILSSTIEGTKFVNRLKSDLKHLKSVKSVKLFAPKKFYWQYCLCEKWWITEV